MIHPPVKSEAKPEQIDFCRPSVHDNAVVNSFDTLHRIDNFDDSAKRYVDFFMAFFSPFPFPVAIFWSSQDVFSPARPAESLP